MLNPCVHIRTLKSVRVCLHVYVLCHVQVHIHVCWTTCQCVFVDVSIHMKHCTCSGVC